MARFRWGLLCSWAESPHERPQPINARAESVAYTFGENLREKRCLVPADGFFEWRTEGKRKRANYFSMLDGKPFAFAGLWDVWEGEETKIASACIVTTTPNELVRTVHDRMPVILPRENYAEWLAPETPVTRLLELLNPYPADVMRAREVGIAVNSPKNDGPECLEVA
jgi:putative SOS response-associated peptidase YedK